MGSCAEKAVQQVCRDDADGRQVSLPQNFSSVQIPEGLETQVERWGGGGGGGGGKGRGKGEFVGSTFVLWDL